MTIPRILLTIDALLLASPSRDTFVLARKVNGIYNTALAVASINPRDEMTSPLYSQNAFAWDNTFRVAVSYSADRSSGGGGALRAAVTNAVEIGNGETVRFNRNVLMQPTTVMAAATGNGDGGAGGDRGGPVVGQLDGLRDNSNARAGGRCAVFWVADVPLSCRVEVMQSVGGGGHTRTSCCRVFQSEEGGLSRTMEFDVSNTFMLCWTDRPVPLGGRVVLSEHMGFPVTINEHDDVVVVRYGFMTPNQPRGDESPGWHQQPFASALVDDTTYTLNLTRISM